MLWDAVTSGRSISTFLEGVSKAEYVRDLLRRRAVERELEIVGEALGKLRKADPETAARIPFLNDAVGLRNVLIHGYAEVIDERIYDTAVRDVPELVVILAALLDGDQDQ